MANLANCDISPNFIRQHKYYRLPVYGLIHVPLHLRILNYTRQEQTMSTSILKYFKLVKPAADRLSSTAKLSDIIYLRIYEASAASDFFMR